MDKRIRPLTRTAAALLVFGILAGVAFALWTGDVPRRPHWSEALGGILVMPTLLYVAVTGRTPRWIRWLEPRRNR